MALVDRGGRLTYGELWERARILGAFLRARGVGAEARVGIYADPSVALAVAVWGRSPRAAPSSGSTAACRKRGSPP